MVAIASNPIPMTSAKSSGPDASLLPQANLTGRIQNGRESTRPARCPARLASSQSR